MSKKHCSIFKHTTNSSLNKITLNSLKAVLISTKFH